MLVHGLLQPCCKILPIYPKYNLRQFIHILSFHQATFSESPFSDSMHSVKLCLGQSMMGLSQILLYSLSLWIRRRANSAVRSSLCQSTPSLSDPFLIHYVQLGRRLSVFPLKPRRIEKHSVRLC